MTTAFLQQRSSAKIIADRQRLALKELKADLAAGTMAESARLAMTLLETEDERIANVDLGPFLTWPAHFGRRRVKPFLMRQHISVWAKCGALTPRQRGVVLDFLRAHA